PCVVSGASCIARSGPDAQDERPLRPPGVGTIPRGPERGRGTLALGGRASGVPGVRCLGAGQSEVPRSYRALETAVAFATGVSEVSIDSFVSWARSASLRPILSMRPTTR